MTQKGLVGLGCCSSTDLSWKNEHKETRLRPKTSLEKPGGGRRGGWERRKFNCRKRLAVPNGLLWTTSAPAWAPDQF